MRREFSETTLIGASTAAELCGFSEPTWRRMVRAGLVPKPSREEHGIQLWNRAELQCWETAGRPSLREWEEETGVPR